MKKAEIFWQTETQNGLSKLRIIFLSELAKVFLRKKIIFPNSLPFSFCFDIAIHGAHLRAAESQLKTFSVIQLSNDRKNKKERQLSSLFRELSRYRSKNNFEFSKNKLAKFLRFGSGKLIAPAFLNLSFRAV